MHGILELRSVDDLGEFRALLELLTNEVQGISERNLIFGLHVQESFAISQEVENLFSRAAHTNYEIFCRKLGQVFARSTQKFHGIMIVSVDPTEETRLGTIRDRIIELFKVRAGITPMQHAPITMAA